MAYQPGSSDVATYQRKEIRAILTDERLVNVTLGPLAADADVGTVLGMVTATNLFAPYNSANTDGTQVARVILAEPAFASTNNQNVAVYLNGIFYKDKLIGLDANAITNLGAREPIPNILIVPGC